MVWYCKSKSIDHRVLIVDPNNFFTNDNLSASKVYYAEGTNFDDSYTAQNFLQAGFASFYLPINEKFNATFGFRGEYNQQMLQSRQRGGGAAIDVNNPIFSPLPSVNAMYKFNVKNILRFGYGSTVNRPEFRELAPFTYYDFAFDVQGEEIRISKLPKSKILI